jgi:hypothetical protein
MRRIRGQIEKEKPSFLPDRPQLPHFMIAVDGGTVKYDKRVLMHMEGECIKKTDSLVRGDTLHRGETLIMVLAVNHSKEVEPCGSLGRDTYLLSGQLPAAGNVSPGTDMALIRIVEGNTPSLSFCSSSCSFPYL